MFPILPLNVPQTDDQLYGNEIDEGKYRLKNSSRHVVVNYRLPKNQQRDAARQDRLNTTNNSKGDGNEMFPTARPPSAAKHNLNEK
eukprot:scaffold6761_cov159-Amphora_coffeaeformis.AAC.8